LADDQIRAAGPKLLPQVSQAFQQELGAERTGLRKAKGRPAKVARIQAVEGNEEGSLLASPRQRLVIQQAQIGAKPKQNSHSRRMAALPDPLGVFS
jgi:hypothetical protein